MFRVVIIDDEKIVRLALRTMIDWEKLGFTVAECYGDAEMALQNIYQDRPDLIITDIVMPKMNGIRFIDEARKKLPDCLFIVLSNYDSFDYAVDAIRLGVLDYIIKTDISPETLEVLIRKAADRIAGVSSAERKTEVENSFQKDEKLLLEAVRNSDTEKKSLSRIYRICTANVYCEENYTAAMKAQTAENLQLASKNGIRKAFYHLLCEKSLFAKRVIYPENGDPFFLIASEEAEEFLNSSGDQCYMLNEFSVSVLNRPSVFLLSEPFADTNVFLSEYAGCLHSVPEAFFRGSGKLYQAHSFDSVTKTIETDIDFVNLCRDLQQLILSGKYETAAEMITGFFAGENIRFLPGKDLASYLKSLGIFLLLTGAVYLQKDRKENTVTALKNAAAMEQYLNLLSDLIQEMKRQEKAFLSITEIRELNGVTEYIHRNATERITLSKLAGSVHMTESYISRIFKNAAGINIVTYVNLVKMKLAGDLLLRSGWTVGAVAAELGYAETSYFIKLFRQIYGVGPGDYKRFMDTMNCEMISGEIRFS